MRWIGLVFVFSMMGCAFDFDEVYEVESLRVLGVSAEPPEITPGEGTTVSVLWADPEGNGREVTFVWWFCAGFVPAGDVRYCEMIAPPVTLTSADGGDRLVIPSTPEDILDTTLLPTGESSLTATLIGLVCADGKLASDKVLRKPTHIQHTDELCKGGEAVSFYRTVKISETDTPQQNPGIDAVTVDGEPVTSIDDDPDATPMVYRCKTKDECDLDIDVSLSMTEGSQQSYEIIEFDKPTTTTEKLFVSWYATSGDFEDGYRSMVDKEASNDPTGPFEIVWQPEEPGHHTLYAVAHDTRGGTSWQRFEFDIEPPR